MEEFCGSANLNDISAFKDCDLSSNIKYFEDNIGPGVKVKNKGHKVFSNEIEEYAMRTVELYYSFLYKNIDIKMILYFLMVCMKQGEIYSQKGRPEAYEIGMAPSTAIVYANNFIEEFKKRN